MNRLALLVLIVVSSTACKHKKKADSGESFFPVLSFLQSQVKNVDTSLYRIVQLEKWDTSSATTYINRNQFRSVADPFLQLPDISSEKWKEDYEESKIFDENTGKVILSYTTLEKENEIQREDVILVPGEDGNDKVETIIIHQVKDEGDSTMIRNMVWYVDKRFTIVTKTQRGNGPELVRTKEVVWNDFIDRSRE